MTMNETVDSVYRFVTDQSSSAYSKMNSFVASLRRRFDKILTTTSSNESATNHQTSTGNEGENALLDQLLTEARLLLSINNINNNTDQQQEHIRQILLDAQTIQQHNNNDQSPTTTRYFIEQLRSVIFLSDSDRPSSKVTQRENKDESKVESNVNIYDTLHKNRPFVRSNPNIHLNNKTESSKTTAQMQRISLRSSMRHFIKRRSIKGTNKKFLGSSEDQQTPHIYESLDTPTPDSSITTNPIIASTSSAMTTANDDESTYISATLTPPVFKSVYVIPTSLVVLDHFTTNLYLVVNAQINQLLVVFGSTKIHTIKLYDTDGKKLPPTDLRLQYKFEELHGYKLMSSALNNNQQNRIIVNEIRVYVSHTTEDIHNPTLVAPINTLNNQTLKQRLLIFDDQGHFISASKRLPVNNELLFVEVDRQDGSIYAYDGYHLVNTEYNWSTVVENIDCIASGSNVLVCLHGKTNQISIYNSHTGSFIYRWLITSPNARNLQSIHLCISRHDLIHVLVWNCDVHPVNNIVLVFDYEGQLRREYFVPNRLLPNMHGTYSYEMTLGNGSHHTANSMTNFIRRPSRKFDVHPVAWIQPPPIWSNNNPHAQLWQGSGTAVAGQFQALHRTLAHHPYDFIFQQQQQQQQHQQQASEDPTLFHPRFIAMTDDDTLILSNIIDLGLDEETQETAMVNVSRKILFFHLDE